MIMMIMQDEPFNKGGYLGQSSLTGRAERYSEISCETTLAGMRLPTMSQVQYFLLNSENDQTMDSVSGRRPGAAGRLPQPSRVSDYGLRWPGSPIKYRQ